MSTRLRWGLLGTARVNRHLIPALRASRRSELIAVASRDETRASAYARAWNIPTAYTSYDALLRDRRVDAVYVPVPNALHVEWTLRALDAGKHVLCEKPLALSGDDVDRVAALARASGRVVAEGFMYRHEPLMARVLEIVRSGSLGALRTVSSGFTFPLDRPRDVRLDPALGGGSLWDVGCYAVHAVRLVAGGEPEEAYGVAQRGLGGVDETFTGLLRFPGGVAAAIHSSFRAPYRMWLEAAGEAGTLRVMRPFKPSALEHIELELSDGASRVAVEGSPLPFARQLEDFTAAALDGRPTAVTLADSRGNAAALAALDAAGRSGRAVPL